MPPSIPNGTLEKFTTFGDLLRYLRRSKGMTQLELSFQVGYSHAQISRLEQNLRLPDIPIIAARFVPALGLHGEPKAAERLLELAARVRREDAPAPGLCPYKGLNYFDEADADLFVGRESLTEKLVERVHSLATIEQPGQARFLAIVGASGSGKSSLARAGLVPALHWNQKSADWEINVLTPTAHPLESLGASLIQEVEPVFAAGRLLDDLAGDSHNLHLYANRKLRTEINSHLLLVVDQFEELFSLCRSEEERVSFIDNLLTASSDPDGRVIVVITLRADFYAHCSNYDELRAALAQNQEYIGAMSANELRRVIEEPARRGRWEFEPGLVDLLLHDVGYEPGALPLLSHALLETWHRRRGSLMTLSGYASSGGVHGAIAETAEAVFTDQFTNQQQSIARRIFLRLTELGDEPSISDTRRRATFDELISKPEETAITQAVLKALADARLITTNQDSAEVAHEALIREWPTLRGWLEENRAGLRLHRHLTEAAQEWLGGERATDVLYRGARLANAREWASTHQDDLNALEREFLSASIDLSEREASEREAQRQRELDSARKLAETEKQRAAEKERAAAQLRRRLIYLLGVLTLAVIAALVAGFFANRNAINLTHSEAQRLAAEANSLMLNGGDVNLIALLSIRSLNKQYTPYGDAILAGVTTLEAPPREFRGHASDIWGVAFSPDGKYLATGSSDKTARLWDLATGQTIRIFSGHSGEVGEVAFSPDGKYLLSTGSEGTARLWDIASGETIQVFSGHTSWVSSAAFSPDGKTIVTSGGDPTARIWDVATGETLHVLTGHHDLIPRVAFSPDGKYVLTGGIDKTARLWDAATGSEVRVIRMPSNTESVAFSPDGKTIAIGNSDHVARVWEVATGKLVREFSGHQGFVQGIMFSPDGHFLLTGSADKTARLWDLATGQTIRIFSGHKLGAQGVSFSPDGRLIATAGDDGIVRVWDLQTFPSGMQLIGHGGAVFQASFSPDGKQVVTASQDDTARIWNTVTGQAVITLTGHTSEVRSAVFSPDGKSVLTASRDRTARLWDALSGEELRRFEGHTDIVERANFSPNGKYILTTSYDGTTQVWDAQTAQTVLIYTNPDPKHTIGIAFAGQSSWAAPVAISPDERVVATSGDDGTARIWELLTGKDLMVFRGHTDIVAGVAFSWDGETLVTSSYDGSVRLWEVSSGKELRRFAGHPGGALGAAFSPDGKTVLTSGVDGTARLWDVQTGRELRRFIGHTNRVTGVTFSPDGKTILTASDDNTARLWPVDLEDTIRAVCARLTRDLTPEERIQYNISDQRPTCPKE